MLAELLPKAHVRYVSLPVLGQHIEEFVVWLYGQGYPHLPVRRRVRAARRLDRLLWRQGVRSPGELTAADLLEYAPVDSQDDIDLAAVVRSLIPVMWSCRATSADLWRVAGLQLHITRHCT